MGRKPCEGLKKGAWTSLEDQILIDYVNINGEGKWTKLSKLTGLERGGKSCRLRWLNYLRPNIKRGNISEDEEELIIRLHKLLGNRWCLIAGRLPGRTDNEIKNYWNTNLNKKVKDQVLVAKQSSSTQTTFPSSPNKGMEDMLHMNNNTDEAAASRIYEEIKTEEIKGDFNVIDVGIGQLCLSELLELDVDDFNTTMRSTFGEDFADLEAAAYDDE